MMSECARKDWVIKVEEFFWPEGGLFPALRGGLRLGLIVAIAMWCFADGLIYVSDWIDGTIYKKADFRKEGISPDSVILIPIDGVAYKNDSDLIRRHVDTKKVKSKALRDYVDMKVAECKAKAIPKKSARVDVAGGLYVCVIDGKPVRD